MLDFERVYMSIEGHNRMREADTKSGIIPVYKEQFLKRNNLIFSITQNLKGEKMKTKVIITILFLLACIQPANAYLVTIQIEAVVDSVTDDGPDDGYLDGLISPGDIITGWYIFESTTIDTNPSSQVGDYFHYSSPYGIFLTVGGFNFETNSSDVRFLLEMVNDSTSGGLHDSYGLISYNNLSLYNGTSTDEISWWLRDSSATALSSDALFTTAPNLDEWQSIIGLRIYGERGEYGIDATVTSAVPEPTTIALLGLGCLLLKKRS